MIRNILIGGTAGHGINTISYFLINILRTQGYEIHTMKDYMSRVRGGVNFTHLRFGDEPILSHDPVMDLVVALNQEAADLHGPKLHENGYLICDEGVVTHVPNTIQLPFKEITSQSENPKGLSSLAVGAILKAIGLDDHLLRQISVPNWTPEIIQKNFETALAAYNASRKVFEKIPSRNGNTLYMSGNQAIAMGALAGGLDFYCAYPMAPSTGIMGTLSKFESKTGILVEQAEDEIAAINAVIGASAAGARSMTGSSGGGFSLMVEALGFSGIGEVPIVVVDVQRPGPATGLPTRTEQSDLSFVLTASQGEMPRMVMAVKNVADAFHQTHRALNIAETYRIPVILLSDQYLADMAQTFEEPDLDALQIHHHLDHDKALDDLHKTYALDRSLHPRMLPGQSGTTLTLLDSHEHDEVGHITEDAELRTQMMHMRMKKLDFLKQDVKEPDYIGPEDPAYVLVAWGSLDGPVRESVQQLNAQGHAVGALIFGDLYPLPEKSLRKLHHQHARFINIEMNYTGQLGRLIRMETGIEMWQSMLQFDGRQMNFRSITKTVKELMRNDSK